ncbi:probable carboxylesterase 3 [Asparagus officinalis]|nr:probable carboxylesterase 3 [Asparagus officinalis]
MYIHGGGFFIGSPYEPMYHNYLVSVVAAAVVVAVSIEYRLAPKHLLPSAYDDAFTAFDWILSRADPWLAERGDYERLFVSGGSAGANIAHNLTMKRGVRIEGMILTHPYFWGATPIDGEITIPL